MSVNADLWKRREAAVPRGVASMHQRFFHEGANAHVTDAEGGEYIDFATGIAVCNTGHSHPRIVAAVKDQLDRFSHCSFQVTPYESYIALAEKLNARAPVAGDAKTIFLSTGAEALENAVKIARSATGRRGVITFQGGYHGRTLLTLAMTGKTQPYKAQFGPMPGDIFHTRFPIPYHGFGDDAAIEGLNALFASAIEPEAVAAIVLEPVLGEGGFYTASYDFFRALREICDRHGILLIADEVQSGFARTGELFAMDWVAREADVRPDMMTVAKAMAGGFPISGVIGRADLMDTPGPGGLGGTYGGSPLGCVAGLEVLDIIDEEDLCARARLIGSRIKERMRGLGLSCIGDVRGPGAMVAMELVKDGDPSRPDPELTKAIVAQGLSEGLLLLSCGIRGNVVRFLPALTMPDDVLEDGLDRIEKVVRAAAG
ncbi:4-aminobutyrate--2-oxoglutarate transaminase [Aurantiacibacter rhizosphaerae]|uniref:4-aminobutyrate--2-oxoglutarate transaminase n=1 Tax=Aurantiacibacter rhizosphaerae TaxID=2691582 RepID=A0A844XCP6_9SPHN|nr:4-aminobutyrate--2-oxoglutarate transaminase [Aurantiacibacter rhizosphaerae]MWV27539.1 4-aminobutyrate--2-oxoglutarate transaminase [Aurantiacibacter rhizosphaerae]